MKESFRQELYSMLLVRKIVMFYVKVNAISSGVSTQCLCDVFLVKEFLHIHGSMYSCKVMIHKFVFRVNGAGTTLVFLGQKFILSLACL